MIAGRCSVSDDLLDQSFTGETTKGIASFGSLVCVCDQARLKPAVYSSFLSCLSASFPPVGNIYVYKSCLARTNDLQRKANVNASSGLSCVSR